jgi:hypothetical protein
MALHHDGFLPEAKYRDIPSTANAGSVQPNLHGGAAFGRRVVVADAVPEESFSRTNWERQLRADTA